MSLQKIQSDENYRTGGNQALERTKDREYTRRVKGISKILGEIYNLFYNTLNRHERHECDTNDTTATRKTRGRHERKILILIPTRTKTYFHSSVLAIWQMTDYKDRNNFIICTIFWKCLVPMLKCIWKVHHKNWTLWW